MYCVLIRMFTQVGKETDRQLGEGNRTTEVKGEEQRKEGRKRKKKDSEKEGEQGERRAFLVV